MNVEEVIKTNHKLSVRKKTIIHMSLIYHKIFDLIGLALKPYEISIQQYNVLSILRGQKGKPANLSTINERMVSKMSNTTRLVDKLILKQLVDRQICEHNRRKVEIIITERGLSFLKEIDVVMQKAESEVLNNFEDTELTDLNKLLDKF